LLLRTLRETGAGDAVTTLLARDPAGQANLDYPDDVGRLLWELRGAGDGDAACTLAGRAANAGMFHLYFLDEFCPDEASSYPFGREPDGAPSQAWSWLGPAS
jgi:hypothetical protein